PGEARWPARDHIPNLIIGIVGRCYGNGRIQMVVIKSRVGGHHVDVDAQGVHIRQTFLRGPAGAWRQLLASATNDGILPTTGVLLAPHSVPVAASLGGP